MKSISVNIIFDRKPIYVKLSASRGEVDDKRRLNELIAQGDAFTNVTQVRKGGLYFSSSLP
jgi:hypothetical protein